MKSLIIMGCSAALFLGLYACNKYAVSPTTNSNAARTASTDTTKTGKDSLTAVAVTDLPATITTYISTNYAGATIKEAGKTTKGTYLVGIEVNSLFKLLVFKADGTFEKELSPMHGRGRGHHHGDSTAHDSTHHAFPKDSTHHAFPKDSTHHVGPGKVTVVATADLPAAITSYISTNYAGSTIKQAAKEGTSGDYLVYITTADKKPVILAFSSAGAFIKVVKRR